MKPRDPYQAVEHGIPLILLPHIEKMFGTAGLCQMMLIVGEPHSGKTRLGEALRARYSSRCPDRSYSAPHLHLSQSVDLEGLCFSIFYYYGLARRRRINLIEEAMRLLTATRAGMLVLDDADNLAESRNNADLAAFLANLVQNEICTVILCCSKASQRKLSELAARAGIEVLVENIPSVDDTNMATTIESLHRSFPCQRSLRASSAFRQRLMAATEGRLGAICSLWKRAAVNALMSGRMVSESDFACAFGDQHGPGDNPFGLNPKAHEFLSSFRATIPTAQPASAETHANRSRVLPVTITPIEDESLLGFVLRLGEANCLGHLDELTDLSRAVLNNGSPETVQAVATMADVHVSELEKIAYRYDPERRAVSFMGRALPEAFLDDRRRLCPTCMAKHAYHRAIWDLAPLTVCVEHRVCLVSRCPLCMEKLAHGNLPMTKCNHGRGMPLADARQLRCTMDFLDCRPRAASLEAVEQGERFLRAINKLPRF